MSNSGNRKSMDDVLASIRRIVRSETPANGEPGAEEPPASAPVAEDETFSLTPDMRVDTVPQDDPWSSPLREVGDAADEVMESVEDTAAHVEEAAESLVEEVVPAPAEEPDAAAEEDSLVIDEAALEQMIRDVIRDELVNGEIGRNISVNVQRMIEAEIAKAMKV